MTFQITKFIIAIRSNFWFLPLLLSLLAIFLAFFMLDIDSTFKQWGVGDYFSFLSLPLETARLVLSTIAGAMITVVSLVFSMTLVALILVSQQLGPRILIQFMDDRPTQITLGLFNATFLYSLIVLTRVDSDAVSGEVPGLTVALSLILTIASIATLIHFIHHISTRIQADVIVTELGKDLFSAIHKQQDNLNVADHKLDLAGLNKMIEEIEGYEHCSIALQRSGYIQQYDEMALRQLAEVETLIFQLEARQGDFILPGINVLKVYSKSSKPQLSEICQTHIRDCISVSETRTPEATINFEFNAISEVALRALSSGINDPQTAIFCINQLSEGLSILLESNDQRQTVQDEEGVIRIIYPRQNFEHTLAIAFDGILDSAQDNKLVLEHLLSILDQLMQLAQSESHKKAIENFRSRVDQYREQRNFSADG